MQRCPQCEFIYEDDQSRCDMDGVELVRDTHPLPRLQALAVTTSSEPVGKRWRSRVIPFAAALVLALVMALVYYVSVSRSSRPASTAGMTKVETPATISEPSPATNAVSASQEAKNKDQPAASSEKSDDSAGPTRETTAPAVNTESKQTQPPPAKKTGDRTSKSTSRAQSNNQPRPTTPEPAEKDSKVRTAIKKTGRFFKRIF